MLIRERLERQEMEYLSPLASYSACSRGRAVPEEECDIRTVFQRDRDRILHSKAFRRLKDKTQVFLSPRGDHYRTRLTHTLEVSQNARTIARALKLNEELVEAIALGHDLGHTPFGHAGERALNEICPLGFDHSRQSLRVVELLERHGRGLNLTWETRDGILNHQMSSTPHTMEGKIVRLSDKIAYIHHDMDDALRAGILTEEDIPEKLSRILGNSLNRRLDTMIHDMITTSMQQGDIAMSEEVFSAVGEFRAFMFQWVYTDPRAMGEEGRVRGLIQSLYTYFLAHTEELPEDFLSLLEKGEEKERVICDYVASMSDRFAIDTYVGLNIPRSFVVS